MPGKWTCEPDHSGHEGEFCLVDPGGMHRLCHESWQVVQNTLDAIERRGLGTTEADEVATSLLARRV